MVETITTSRGPVKIITGFWAVITWLAVFASVIMIWESAKFAGQHWGPLTWQWVRGKYNQWFGKKTTE